MYDIEGLISKRGSLGCIIIPLTNMSVWTKWWTLMGLALFLGDIIWGDLAEEWCKLLGIINNMNLSLGDDRVGKNWGKRIYFEIGVQCFAN
jgi:hypothetical protein